MDGALNDPYFVLLVLSCAAVITIGAIVTALNRIPRPEFARLKNELKELAGRVKALEAAEQRRFLRELNAHNKGAEAPYADNGSGQLEAGGRPLSSEPRGPRQNLVIDQVILAHRPPRRSPDQSLLDL